ncbi:MAG TPA: hypothetical protein PKL78_07200 [Anaerolineales bacterium]|nr:hypothetical protein [Anaerolineales bacterium]HNN13325.1 hypothetical protein [Anaerolineales bacterium]HNO30414.1 hypothetical protein [Anaerolineales bacterium]
MMRKALSGIGSIFRSPFGVVIIIAAVWHGVVWAFGIPFNYFVSAGIFVLDTMVAITLLDRLTYFFSQFVLPIQNPKYRQEIYSRVQIFESGERGPTLFVKNGRVIEHEGEADKRGPGVIVLDTASAIVTRTDSEIKGAFGPGIKFTEKNEYIANKLGVDLRAQWQFVGPLTTDQPFLNPVPISNPKQFNDLEKRRLETAGQTRDGFEVSPTISIKFSIRRPGRNMPTESGVRSEYGYDATAVRNAVTREVIELGRVDNKKDRMEWNKLPGHLAVNIWREYIRKFKLEDLFSSKGENGLQVIEEMMNKRMKSQTISGLDDTGKKTGEALDSLEFLQLKLRGIEVMEVRIHNVLFDPTMEEQILKQWSGEWMKIAKKEEGLLAEEEKLVETMARKKAARLFANIAAKNFTDPESDPQDIYTTLQNLIEPFNALLIENQISNETESEIRKVDEIWKWLTVNKVDSAKKSEQDR